MDSRIVRTPCARAISVILASSRRHFGLAALDLDDQHRLDVEGIAGMGEILGDMDRGLVHIFHRHRQDAGADDRGDALAGGVGRIEPEQHRPRAFGEP